MAADPSYNTVNYEKQGGAEWVIGATGKLTIISGGLILPDGVATAVTLVAPAATAATNAGPYGYAQAQADAIVTWIRAADARFKLLGIAA